MFEYLLLMGMKQSGLKSQTEHTFFNGFEAPLPNYVFTTYEGEGLITYCYTMNGKA